MRLCDLEQIDPIHEIGQDADGHLTPTTEFDFDEVDRNVFGIEDEESVVPFSYMAAALAIILQWACASQNLTHCGAGIAALLCLLDPTNAPHGRTSLSEIARQAGCTKAAVSRWILDLKDQAAFGMSIGKGAYSRDIYKRAQIASVANGDHAGFKRRAKRAAREQEAASEGFGCRQ